MEDKVSMSSDDTIYVQIAGDEITEEEQEVIDYTKEFLSSDKKDLMEHCFESIRNSNNERVFKDSIITMDDQLFDTHFLFVSNVILTANKVECDSLNYIISKIDGTNLKRRKHYLQIIPNYNVGSANAYLFKYKKYYLLHINAYETGSNTPGGSADIVRFISNHPLLKPSSIISFGVCYGRTPASQHIGDVIIPQKLYPWSIGQKIVDKKLTIKHDNFNLWLFDLFNDSAIYPILKDFCDGEDGKTICGSIKLKDGNKNKKYSFNVKTTMGNISTGEAVISSKDAKRIIPDANNIFKELGGEMEGYGIAKECVYYAHIPCFIIKSICDWGVLKNITPYIENNGCEVPAFLKDKLQVYASFCAGIVLFQLLSQESEKIIKLKVYDDFLNNKDGKDFFQGIAYYTKQQILDWVKQYYKMEINDAEYIFNLLLDKGIISNTMNLKEKYKFQLEGDV